LEVGPFIFSGVPRRGGLAAASARSSAATDATHLTAAPETGGAWRPAYGQPDAYFVRKQEKSWTLSTGGLVELSQFA
jgi:hypothetical protein